MANLPTSLDTSILTDLYKDDWETLYAPLQFVDTNLYGSSTGNNVMDSKIRDIMNKMTQYDTNVANYEALPSRMDTLDSSLTDLSTNLAQVKQEQENIKDWLSDILDWENMSR